MTNPITKKVFGHLEYLGYKVKDMSEKESKENLDFLIGKSERKSNLLVRISKDDTIFISARYTLSDSDKIVTEDFLNKLNILNSRSTHTKVFYIENSREGVDLIIETFVINYDRLTLTAIIDILESDVVVYLKEIQEYCSLSPKVNYGQTIVNELMDGSTEEENIPNRIGF